MVGAPRTGTTLLANVLGAHPRIAMFDEEFHGAARFVIGNKIPAVKLCTPSQIQFTKKWKPYFKVLQKMASCAKDSATILFDLVSVLQITIKSLMPSSL